jgi:hypothetical protein
MNSGDVTVYLPPLAAIVAVAVPWGLGLMAARDWIKGDLEKKGLRPLVIGWRAFAWRPMWGPTFRVLYTDADGVVHKADCSLRGWHRPAVLDRDRILGGV